MMKTIGELGDLFREAQEGLVRPFASVGKVFSATAAVGRVVSRVHPSLVTIWRWKRAKRLILVHMMADHVPLWTLQAEPLETAIAGMAWEAVDEKSYPGDVAKHWRDYYRAAVTFTAMDRLALVFYDLAKAGIEAAEAFQEFGRALGEQKWSSRS